jgi:tryptophan synthase alpha chain
MSELPRDRLSRAVRQPAAGAPALVAGMTAGFPQRAKFREHVSAIGAAADVVEICVPFSDPMADGLTIQRSSHEALKQGVTLKWILGELTAMGAQRTPLLLMSYLNPLLAFGYDRLAVSAAAAGVCGFIVPDLPLGEDTELRAALESHGLALVQMVTPVTPPERMQRLCAASQGFVYAVTMTGTTGGSKALQDDVVAYLERVRALSKVPVCAGFGIRDREQVRKLRGHVDGVIVASALVELLERGEAPQPWLATLRT